MLELDKKARHNCSIAGRSRITAVMAERPEIIAVSSKNWDNLSAARRFRVFELRHI